MPTISWFYGISIRMFFNDHSPPHFHAFYGRHEAQVAIADGEVVNGDLPSRQRRLVRRWTLMYQSQLMDNWIKARKGEREMLQRIPGLDAEHG